MCTMSIEITSLTIKDPSAKGNVTYSVPLDKIETTYGFTEHCKAVAKRPEKKVSHRPCLCKLYQEGRCRQGVKCKSFHVCRDFVQRKRVEEKVELEERFLNEVVVATQDGLVFAVRFPAVLRTAGLDAYVEAVKASPDDIKAAPMCEAYNKKLGKGGSCTEGKNCTKIHVNPAELKGLSAKRLRTPCCGAHGAIDTPQGGSVVVMAGGQQWDVPASRLAVTEGFKTCPSPSYDEGEVCTLHVQSRCKYGKACDKLHICRAYAQKTHIIDHLVQRADEASTRATPVSDQSQGELLTPYALFKAAAEAEASFLAISESGPGFGAAKDDPSAAFEAYRQASRSNNSSLFSGSLDGSRSQPSPAPSLTVSECEDDLPPPLVEE